MSEKRGIGQALLSLFTLLVTVVGAGIAFVEYRGAQQRERVERVFNYSDQLAAESEAIARINALADGFYTAWPDIVAQAGESPTEERLTQLSNDWYVGVIGQDPDLRSAVDRLAMFYDRLAVCVSEGLCDEHAAKALFTEPVAAFASTVQPWVAHRHQQFLSATGIRALCLRNRFCGGETECTGLPQKLADCQ
jgi:hypothetical protein